MLGLCFWKQPEMYFHGYLNPVILTWKITIKSTNQGLSHILSCSIQAHVSMSSLVTTIGWVHFKVTMCLF